MGVGGGVCRWNLEKNTISVTDVGRAKKKKKPSWFVTGQERVHPRDSLTLTPVLRGPALTWCLTHISQQRSDLHALWPGLRNLLSTRLRPSSPPHPPSVHAEGEVLREFPKTVLLRCLFGPHVLLSVNVVRVPRCSLQWEPGASIVKHMILFIIAF